MLSFAKKVSGAELRAADFRAMLRDASNGDVVYCDPPYVPLSPTADFTDYASGGFGTQDQTDLAELAFQGVGRGAVVVVSNHDTPVTRELYARAVQLVPLMVSRTISCDGANRTKARELIAVFRRRS
jgi:DNA adenine methylase